MIGPSSGSQNVSQYGGLPHQTRDLERFADRTASMESAHQFSSRPDCNNTAEVPSFTLRTVLSTVPFVSDLCGVRRTMIPGKIFTGFAKFQELSV